MSSCRVVSCRVVSCRVVSCHESCWVADYKDNFWLFDNLRTHSLNWLPMLSLVIMCALRTYSKAQARFVRRIIETVTISNRAWISSTVCRASHSASVHYVQRALHQRHPNCLDNVLPCIVKLIYILLHCRIQMFFMAVLRHLFTTNTLPVATITCANLPA